MLATRMAAASARVYFTTVRFVLQKTAGSAGYFGSPSCIQVHALSCQSLNRVPIAASRCQESRAIGKDLRTPSASLLTPV